MCVRTRKSGFGLKSASKTAMYACPAKSSRPCKSTFNECTPVRCISHLSELQLCTLVDSFFAHRRHSHRVPSTLPPGHPPNHASPCPLNHPIPLNKPRFSVCECILYLNRNSFSRPYEGAAMIHNCLTNCSFVKHRQLHSHFRIHLGKLFHIRERSASVRRLWTPPQQSRLELQDYILHNVKQSIDGYQH